MMKFFNVKEKARGLARQQKYDLALVEYRAAIHQAEADHEISALRNLYNAAGDASLQKNDTATAVEYFEKAADSYLEEGLHDNAIALCHKILRHVPTKAETYAKLGRIYGEKGLRNEAIQNWLEYAERRRKAEDTAGMIRAFREVISLSPDADAVRLQLAEILLARREAREALVELEELKRRAQLAGDTERAEELAGKVTAVRVEYGIEDLDQPGYAGAELGVGEQPAAGGARDLQGDLDGDLHAQRFPSGEDYGPERAGDVPAPGTGALPGLDPGFGFPVEAPAVTPPGQEAGLRSGTAPAAFPIPEPGPALEPAGSLGSMLPPRPPSPFAPVAGEEASDVGSLPGFTLPEREPPQELGVEPVPYVPVEERIARAEARLAENPSDAEERIYLGELYQESGAVDLARNAMEQGARELDEAGQHDKAYRAYRRLAGFVTGEVEIVQKLVEVARAAGSHESLLESYELLGDRLMEAGRYGNAAEIHRQILEIDPAHRHSQDQLLILTGLEAPASGAVTERARAASPSAEAGEYVDLGQLIAEGEPPRVADPRMSVHAVPTGDEQADLEAIIDTFRRGVIENIEESDFESHYDLGVAFRQMGLLDEAVREFQLAARGSDQRDRAFELMGLCFMEKGMHSVAVNCFRRGIESERDPHQALGLHYHLGRSLEELGDPRGAREEYERVVAVDLQFMDAAERLRKLA